MRKRDRGVKKEVEKNSIGTSGKEQDYIIIKQANIIGLLLKKPVPSFEDPGFQLTKNKTIFKTILHLPFHLTRGFCVLRHCFFRLRICRRNPNTLPDFQV